MLQKLKHKETINKLMQPPKKEIKYPHLQLFSPNTLHEVNVLYLPNDKGYKYVISLIDCYNGLCKVLPMKTLKMSDIIEKLELMYKTPLLKYPNCIQADNQFNIKEFKDWCDSHNINYKASEPGNHRQNAFVERLNQTLGKYIGEIQLNAELETNKPSFAWTKYLPEIENELNNNKLHHMSKDFHIKEPNLQNDIIINKNNNYVIENGTKVRLKMESEAESLQGEKLFGKARANDIKWHFKPIYEVVDSFFVPNDPILYKIKNTETQKVKKALYVAERLQII